jgi:hypothetical protein
LVVSLDAFFYIVEVKNKKFGGERSYFSTKFYEIILKIILVKWLKSPARTSFNVSVTSDCSVGWFNIPLVAAKQGKRQKPCTTTNAQLALNWLA